MKHHLHTIILAAAVAAGIALLLPRETGTTTKASIASLEPAFERVKASGTLRCGYLLWPKWLERDPNTGKMSGAWVDYTEALASALQLKVEWTEETPATDYVSALDSGRIDAFCVPVAATRERIANSYFIDPPSYSLFNAYVRQDDSRFDGALEKINDPAVRITTLEGEITSIVARQQFPKATLIEIPSLAGITVSMMNVATNKADVLLADPGIVHAFNATNDNQLRPVSDVDNLGVFSWSIAIRMGENRLKVMLDTQTADLLQLGTIETIWQKHGLKRGIDYLPAALPYQPGE